jgi:nitrogenase molybdenum-iron protein beta chain
MAVKTVECIERPRAACALSGALAAMSALPGVVPIIHSALGCGGSLSSSFAFGAGYFGSGYCSGFLAPSSGITEREIIFGGNDRLTEEIDAAAELIDANLFVVVTSCMTDMIGDDAQSAAGESASDVPVIALSTPSFKGNAYSGYEILIDGIFNNYLPIADAHDKRLVNIFGIIPAYDPFFRGDLEEIARLLSKLGLRVNTFFTPDQTYNNILSAPSAALNIVFSPVYGTGFAKRFEEKHSTPYWTTDIPIGAEATDRFLRELAAKFDIDEDVVRELIERENREYYGYFSRTADLFSDGDLKYYSVTVTNSNYAVPVASYLQKELGWVGLDAYVTDTLTERQETALRAAYNNAGLDAELLFETDTSLIAKAITQRHPENHGERYFDDVNPLFIVGSTLENATALKRGAGSLSVSYPVYNRAILDRGNAGYRGGLHFFEDILSSIVSPR